MEIKDFSLENIHQYVNRNWFGVVFAIAFLLIGWKLTNYLGKLFNWLLQKTKMDKTVSDFSTKLILYLLKASVIFVFVILLGLPIGSVVALIGSLALALGFILKESLSNLASSLIVLVAKPFSAGDLIEIEGKQGKVKEVTLVYTKVKTLDNKTIMIPNNKFISAAVTNYSANYQRRIDLVFNVGYDSDVKKVKKLINKVISDHPLVLDNENNIVGLKELGSSSLDFAVYVWVKNSDYLTAKFDLNEKILEAFNKHNIEIPFPQQDVYIKNKEK